MSMYGTPEGYYTDCDTAVHADCYDLATWPGFEEWDAPLPIFGDESMDTPQHCAVCGNVIDSPLTDYGVQYVIDALTDVKAIYTRRRNDDGEPVNAGVLSQWADMLEDYAPHVANIGRGILALASDPYRGEGDGPTPYRLALVAGLGGGSGSDPETPTSPGAEFLTGVFSDVMEWARDAGAESGHGFADDVAYDLAPNIAETRTTYNNDLWGVFHDLALWSYHPAMDAWETACREWGQYTYGDRYRAAPMSHTWEPSPYNMARLAVETLAVQLVIALVEGEVT